MVDMTTLEVLRGMRELLDNENRWAKRAPARLPNGAGTNDVLHPEACRWCINGAATRVSNFRSNAAMKVLRNTLNYTMRERGEYISCARWNDDPERTHAEVLELLDRAIAAAAKDQPDGK